MDRHNESTSGTWDPWGFVPKAPVTRLGPYGSIVATVAGSSSKAIADDFTKTPRPFYPKLSLDDPEIRLLHLQSEDDSGKLQCRLSVVSLDSNPVYEALSYTWGPPTDTTSITVDGHDVLVPRNLERALRSLRRIDSERVLWADAICIDQSHIAERNHQVAMMADIYRKCERCIIWLGQYKPMDTDFVKSLSNLLTGLSKKRHLNEPDPPMLDWEYAPPSGPLRLMYRAPWWKRMWIVQEVLLAPQSIVLYEPFEMTFSDLVDAMQFVNEHDMRMAWNVSDQNATDKVCGCLDYFKVKFVWEELLRLRDHVFDLLDVNKNRSQTNVVQTGSSLARSLDIPDLLAVMLSVKSGVCSDARDKVFAVLSLVQDWKDWAPIEADYSQDAVTLYKQLATQLFQGKPRIKTLLLARGVANSSPLSRDLPTWVPDWTRPGPGYDVFLLGTKPKFVEGHIYPAVTDSTLHLHGAVYCGKIEIVSGAACLPPHSGGFPGPAVIDAWERHKRSIEEWLRFAGVYVYNLSFSEVLRYCIQESQKIPEPDTATRSDSGSYARLMADLERSDDTVDFIPQIQHLLAVIRYHQKELRIMDPVETRFFRTLIQDTYPLHLQNPEHLNESLSILRILLMCYHDMADPDRLLTRLNSLILTKFSEILVTLRVFDDRVLFWTKFGKLGMGPKGMRADDELYFFQGLDNPFILRPVVHKVDGVIQQRRHQVVGHCYVYDQSPDASDIWMSRDVYLV